METTTEEVTKAVFTAASHNDVLILLIQIAVLLAVARLLGEVATRIGQPSVLGEISAGILLGPSVLSGLIPAFGNFFIPDPMSPVQGPILEVVSLIGAMFLLLITGLETDLPLIRRHLRTALGVSFGGILVTLSTGFLLGMHLPDDLLANPNQRMVFALFVATAMSISAIPVIAKVLMDLNLMRRDVGQIILAAGMSDDTTGWVLLSIVAALATSESFGAMDIMFAVGKVALFLILSFTVGRWFVQRALSYVQDEITARDRLLTLCVVLAFGFGSISQGLGLEAVLGGFVVGILFSQMRRLPVEVTHKLESIALGIFAPIFFAVAGLKVDVLGLLNPRLGFYAFLVILVACGGKVVGTYIGARVVGRTDHWTALSFGAGLNARGAMEIIIASIGLSIGVLNQAMFSIIVLMAMVTSLLAPSALRWTLSKVVPSDEELKRLEMEERKAASALAELHRVLLPVRVRPEGHGSTKVQRAKALLYRMLTAESELSLTLLSVVRPGEKAAAAAYLDEVSELFSGEVVKRVVESEDPAQAILDEAKKDYQMLVLGATESNGEPDSLFSPAIDEMVRLAPCDTLIIKGPEDDLITPYTRILVPTNGSVASKRAGELAFMLAADGNAEVWFLNVVVRETDPMIDSFTSQLELDLGRGQQIVSAAVNAGELQNIRCQGRVKVGSQAPEVILSTAKKHGIDLILYGTDLRPGREGLYLGRGVERLLKHSDCPVFVFNS